MASPEGSNWVFDCPLMDDLAAADFAAASTGGFYWTPPMQPQMHTLAQAVSATPAPNPWSLRCPQFDCLSRPAHHDNNVTAAPDRDVVLCPALPSAVLALLRLLWPPRRRLRLACPSGTSGHEGEERKKKSDQNHLQFSSKLLRAEKNELRDEKQKLKAEKESLEQQIKFMNARQSLVPHPSVIPAAAFAAAQGQAAGHKLMMPVMSYPGFPMWQFMPPSDVDTSDDPKSCPPVA
ncbi:hypothetical protein TRIUR3_06306 [Triticum urartu]|uniref:Transcription factor ILR3 n=1 Tax=Triticum urartu TaxID=4572 RepID=M7ZPR9_TRIUA|nr:hypothetical protein TRIUR3_06306 [Triticum urartu]